jgi:hypothetical protein
MNTISPPVTRPCSSRSKFPADSIASYTPPNASLPPLPTASKIPVSLVYRKDKREAGRNPLYVYAYGSYGYSLPIGFNANRLSLLDRGVVMAYAHIRGGGDLGKPWHDAGKMLTSSATPSPTLSPQSNT